MVVQKKHTSHSVREVCFFLQMRNVAILWNDGEGTNGPSPLPYPALTDSI